MNDTATAARPDTAATPASLLPPGLAAEVEAATGKALVAVKPRGGGGASREGAEITLDDGAGGLVHAYMNYDVHKAGAGDDAAFLREAGALAALSGPMAGSGVRVARFIAAIPDSRALIAERVSGESNFNALKTAEERRAVAHDFMAQLAALHGIDALAHDIPGMARPASVAAMIRARIDEVRGQADAASGDPLITLTLDWLADNIPPEPERMVIVHGDAGPANFLYADGRVTALLDWELVHYGDPMADLAMLSIRMLFQPFLPLPDAFAAYRAAGGAPVDLDRIRFWRLFFQVQFARRTRYQDPDAPRPPNLGMNLVYSTIHRRVLAEALAEAAGIAITPVALPDAPPGERDLSFEIALEDIRDMIVPRIADQQAAVKAKGLARLVKWWRAIERYGAVFEAAERAELSAALGGTFATAGEGRIAFAQAVAAGRIDRATAIRLCQARESREAALMADAMGSLSGTRFPPLT